MGVTRLERKGRKNKTVAKERVKSIKRLKSKVTIESPYKEESGVVIGEVADVLANIGKAPKAKKAKKAEKVEEKASSEEE